MRNREIYGKTLPFALLRILVYLGALIICVGIVFLTFSQVRNNDDLVVPATTVAVVVAIVLYALIARYGAYLLRAGQIAMIAHGVHDGTLPDGVVAEGCAEVKRRFGTVSAFFVVDSLIRGIGRQLQRGISAASNALGGLAGSGGGDVVRGVGDLVGSLVATVIRYASDCCLGWVFLHPLENAFRSTCDGVSLYFRNWKTLLKNLGRIVGITLLSLVVIGVPVFLLLRAATSGIPDIITAADLAEIDADLTPAMLRIIVQGFLSLAIWGIIHSALVTPYMLVSVMRAYLDAASSTPVDGAVYNKLSGMSKKFRTALDRSGEPQGAEGNA